MSGRIMLDEVRNQEPPPPEPQEKPPQPPESPPPPPPEPEPPPPAAATGPGNAMSAPEGEQTPQPDLQKRLDKLTWEKYDAQRRASEAERQLQAWQEQIRRAQMPAGQGDPRAEALQQFRAEQAQNDFNAACNRVFEQGSRDYTDFSDAVRALNAVGYGNRPDALAAISAMPDGHHVYRALAQDLDNAARVLALPPMHMAMELAKLAHQRGSTPTSNGTNANGAAQQSAAVTRAPAPLRPVGGNSARPEKPLDQMSMAEFIRSRDRDTMGSSRIRR